MGYIAIEVCFLQHKKVPSVEPPWLSMWCWQIIRSPSNSGQAIWLSPLSSPPSARCCYWAARESDIVDRSSLMLTVFETTRYKFLGGILGLLMVKVVQRIPLFTTHLLLGRHFACRMRPQMRYLAGSLSISPWVVWSCFLVYFLLGQQVSSWCVIISTNTRFISIHFALQKRTFKL